MGELLAAFPDAEVVAKTLIDGRVVVGGVAARVVTETPPDFSPPLIEVQRLPGAGANDGLADYPHVQFACFGPDRQTAWAMARAVEQIVLASAATGVVLPDGTNQLIDSARSVNSPDQRPYDDQTKRRVVATYRFAMRRPYRPA